MGRARALQQGLSLFEADGQTHRRDCGCPRCEAGFRPSERERALAAQRWEARQARAAAEAALAKKRAREGVKSLRRTLTLEEAERRTAERLRALAEMQERLRADDRLEALLTSREAGRPVSEALAEAEQSSAPSSRHQA